MGLLTGVSHIKTNNITNKAFQFNESDYLEIDSNSNATFYERIFNEDGTLFFMIDSSKKREILYVNKDSTITSDVDVYSPLDCRYAIINENGYLKIFFHENDGIHSLVYKSEKRILKTLRRKLYTLVLDKLTYELLLYVDSILEPLVIDTSNANYRTDKADFTELNENSSGFIIGGGGIFFPDLKGEFIEYLRGYIPSKLDQSDINQIFQKYQDNRDFPLPSIGKILVSSDRNGTGYDIFQVNSDFTDEILKSNLIGDMFYPTWGKNLLKDDFVFLHQSVPKIFKNEGGIYNIKEFLNKTIQNSYYSNWELFLSTYPLDSVSLGLDDVIDTVHYWNGYSYAKLDTNDISNSMFFPSDFVAKPFTPLFTTSPFVPSARKYVDSHPTDSDKVLITNITLSGGNNGICTIAEWDKVNNTLSSEIYTSGFIVNNSNSGFDNQIQNPKYNSDGTKIGFTAYTSFNANPHAFICDSDGDNLIDLGADIEFCSFASLASDTDTIILFNRYEFSDFHQASFWRIYSRNLTTNEEVNLSGDVDYNDYSCDWKL